MIKRSRVYTRRAILAGTASLAAANTIPVGVAAQPAPPRDLIARPGRQLLLEPGQPDTRIWGYDGQVPGPELRVKQGQEVAVNLVNQLPQATTIHWHGIRIDNDMDGVAGLTQPAVKPNERFTYRFVPPDAGTYWYHPHNRTWEQLARGLQGALIVEEQRPPQIDRDITLIVDDWRIGRDGQIHEQSFGSMRDISHAGRLGNILTLNAHDRLDLPVIANQRLRLRLINTSNARVVGIIFEQHAPIVFALDGQPVAAPFAPAQNMVFLAPAQRADIILDCNNEVGSKTPIRVDTGREKLELGQLTYHPARRARAKVLAGIPMLAPNPMPAELDLANAVTVDLEMAGGAMAPFDRAIYKGRETEIRDLVQKHQKAWAFNGIVGMPDKPLARFERGKTIAIKLTNRTLWPHAMHFHGHHVREISHSAREPRPYWRDTVFIQREQEITVAFQAHNPGKWMLHCHMLAHQAGGMSTWYEVG